MIYNLIGTAGSLCLVFSCLPQIFKCLKEKHADGLSSGLLWLWLVGLTLMLSFLLLTPNSIILVCSCSVQIILVMVLMYFKYFPRRQ